MGISKITGMDNIIWIYYNIDANSILNNKIFE